jgi:hypothetical protein
MMISVPLTHMMSKKEGCLQRPASIIHGSASVSEVQVTLHLSYYIQCSQPMIIILLSYYLAIRAQPVLAIFVAFHVLNA